MEVKIKKIKPGRFASFYGFGKQPEEEAIKKLEKWCKQHNRSPRDNNITIFGFNNPNPLSESSEYGYEFWYKVDDRERPVEDIRIIEYHGGDYAVTECTGAENMFQKWQDLFEWCIDHKYKIGTHQPLERIIENLDEIDEIKVELCCPVILKS